MRVSPHRNSLRVVPVTTARPTVSVAQLEALRASAQVARTSLARLAAGELTTDDLAAIEAAERAVQAHTWTHVAVALVEVDDREWTALWAVHDGLVIAGSQLAQAAKAKWRAQQETWIQRAEASIAGVRSWLEVVPTNEERSENDG